MARRDDRPGARADCARLGRVGAAQARAPARDRRRLTPTTTTEERIDGYDTAIRREGSGARPRRRAADRVGGPADAGARGDPRALRARAAARGAPHLRVPARDDRDGEPRPHAEARAARTSSSARPTRSRRRTTWRRRSSRSTASRVFAIKGEDNDTYYRHIEAAVDHRPHLTMDDGADVIGVLHSARREQLGRRDRGYRGDDDGRHSPEGARARRQARLPRHRGQRGAHEAPLRQPLRHRPVDDRRDHPRDERPPRRQALRRRRLRLDRPRRRHAGPRHGRARHRHRGRSAARARGGDGRLRGAPDGASRPRSATSSAPPPATRTSSPGRTWSE